MTTEEIVTYAERVNQQNRDRVNKYYNNTIKTDPERYKVWFLKCNESNKRQYNKKNEQQQQLVLS